MTLGVTQAGERIWLVTFMHCDLGYFDELEPIDNPFGPKVLPMSAVVRFYRLRPM